MMWNEDEETVETLFIQWLAIVNDDHNNDNDIKRVLNVGLTQHAEQVEKAEQSNSSK